MFSGLMSRWSTRCEWTCARAEHSCAIHLATVCVANDGRGIPACAAIASASEPPSQYSIAMHTAEPRSKQQMYCTTCSWRSMVSTRTSERTFEISSAFIFAASSSIRLHTTCCPDVGLRSRTASPNWPRPRTSPVGANLPR